jgi:hypothetical protein
MYCICIPWGQTSYFSSSHLSAQPIFILGDGRSLDTRAPRELASLQYRSVDTRATRKLAFLQYRSVDTRAPGELAFLQYRSVDTRAPGELAFLQYRSVDTRAPSSHIYSTVHLIQVH